MSLWKLCIIVACALQQTRQQSSALLDLVNWRAKDTLNEAANDDWPILDLVLRKGTCYTDATIPCISKPKTRASPNSCNDIIESYTHSVPFNYDDYPYAKSEPRIRARYFTALLLDEDRTNRQQTQEEVLEDVLIRYYRRGAFLQGYVRMMNAFESAGIAFLQRFCDLMTISFRNRLTVHSELIKEYYDFISIVLLSRFKYLFISPRPIHEIRMAFNGLEAAGLVEQVTIGLKCQEFSQRYGNMIGFVELYQRSDDLDSTEKINEEMKSNMKAAVYVFGKLPWKDD